MLQLISLKSCVAILQYRTDHSLSIKDWNPDTLKTSHFRYMKCTVSAVYADSPGMLEYLLGERPKARIIHILSHEKKPGGIQILDEDGTPYRDDFGLSVFLHREIDWFGTMTDLDERFEETNLLPFD